MNLTNRITKKIKNIIKPIVDTIQKITQPVEYTFDEKYYIKVADLKPIEHTILPRPRSKIPIITISTGEDPIW